MNTLTVRQRELKRRKGQVVFILVIGIVVSKEYVCHIEDTMKSTCLKGSLVKDCSVQSVSTRCEAIVLQQRLP
jgi:hypothetical protein